MSFATWSHLWELQCMLKIEGVGSKLWCIVQYEGNGQILIRILFGQRFSQAQWQVALRSVESLCVQPLLYAIQTDISLICIWYWQCCATCVWAYASVAMGVPNFALPGFLVQEMLKYLQVILGSLTLILILVLGLFGNTDIVLKSIFSSTCPSLVLRWLKEGAY